MSLNESPINPKNNPVVFFTGTDDYLLTRSFGQWLGKSYISMAEKDYKNIYELKDINRMPWGEPVPLDGTDGMQFHPDL